MDNSHKRWTKFEEDYLINLYTNKKKTIYEISQILQRTEWAIQIRLGKLNMSYTNNNNDIISIIKEIRIIKNELISIKKILKTNEEELTNIKDDIKNIKRVCFIDV